MKKYIPLIAISSLSISTLVSTSAYSHGYITNGRAKLCQERQNTDCGPVIYEPQSVEGPDRFPESGPADGTIASAGSGGGWSKLNEQTPTRWTKVNMNSGTNTFNWVYTAAHRTRDWRYFITKPDWDSSKPLSRASFELTPFCSVEGNNEHASNKPSHTCNVPARSGYHVILGVWDVGDTAASFYNVIDANFSGSVPPVDPTPPTDTYKDIGDINPSMTLKVGAVVKLRLFTAQGELLNQSIDMTIESAAHGEANVWPKRLADTINAQGTLKAGIKGTNGNITPNFGRNDVFAKQDSNIVRTEVSIDNSGVITQDPVIDVSLNQASFTAGEKMSLQVTVTVNKKMDIETRLFFNDVSIGYQKQAGVESNTALTINIDDPQVGSYRLVTTGKVVDSDKMTQSTQAITVTESNPTPPSQVSYPAGKGSYTTGSVVTGEDGNSYTCLIANWCNGSSQYYSPGLGLAWQQAWSKTADGTPPKAPEPSSVYPANKGSYTSGDIVQGSDGNSYRCKIENWCNGSSLYYAPGTGLAWQQAWSAL